MTVYRRGAAGPEVIEIQQKLKAEKVYTGAVDGDFGGGTESAVRAYQKKAGLRIDGIVDSATWTRLVGTPIPVPRIVGEDLATRCLALTASFETGAAPPECFATVAGDFDGMGMSFGALQWNIGTDTLQALLHDVNSIAPTVIDEIFHDHAPVLQGMLARPREEQLRWARSIQNPATHRISEPWRGLFKALGRDEACWQAQKRNAASRYARGLALCDQYGLWSERAAALMFDVVVQNGSIQQAVAQQIDEDIRSLGTMAREALEVRKMEIIAARRAAVSRPEWVADVRSRKLTIARGSGNVHGRDFNIEDDYGIRLFDRQPAVSGGSLPGAPSSVRP